MPLHHPKEKKIELKLKKIDKRKRKSKQNIKVQAYYDKGYNVMYDSYISHKA